MKETQEEKTKVKKRDEAPITRNNSKPPSAQRFSDSQKLDSTVSTVQLLYFQTDFSNFN